MIALMWHVSTAIRGCLRGYMPSNVLINWMRTRHGVKWAIPLGIVLATAYLFVGNLITEFLAHGGPRWLNLLVMVFIWNAMKFVCAATLSPIWWMKGRSEPR